VPGILIFKKGLFRQTEVEMNDVLPCHFSDPGTMYPFRGTWYQVFFDIPILTLIASGHPRSCFFMFSCIRIWREKRGISPDAGRIVPGRGCSGTGKKIRLPPEGSVRCRCPPLGKRCMKS